MTFEPGPAPDPDAEPHGDFEPDDLVTDLTDPDPASIYTDSEIATYLL
jgi:hypothetical protein